MPGGTAVAALGLARGLQSLDGLDDRADLDVVGVAARHRRPPPAPWQPPVRVAHVPLPRVVMYEAWHGARWPKVEQATGPVDVVHATSLIVPPTTSALVVTVHDLAFLDDDTRLTARGNRFMRRGVELAKEHAQAVLCSSEATLHDCVRAGFDPDRLRVVHLGTDATPASLDVIAEVRARHRLHHRYVAWVGTVEPRKNLAGLLSAFERVARGDPTLDLVLVGPAGWGPQLDTLLPSLESDLRERVRVIGFVGDDERDAIVAGAAAFCYPSTKEGFGLPVLEAMAQGTPVVTSLGTSTAEVAADAAVLVEPASSDSIADGLARVLGDDALADRLAAAGRARASELTWARCAAQARDLYREVAAERAR